MDLFTDALGVTAIVASPQDGMLAAIDHYGRGLGIYTATGRFWFDLPLPSAFFDVFTALIWSPDGRYVVGGTRQCQVFVWEVRARVLISVYHRHYGPIQDLAWSPTAACLASISSDGSLHLWNPLTGEQLMPPRFLTHQCYALAWSPDGAYLAVSLGRTVQLYSAQRATCLYTYRGHDNDVLSLAWSADGASLVSVSRDATAHLWYVPLGKARWRRLLSCWGLCRLKYVDPSESSMQMVRWSPDGSVIAIRTESGIRVWSPTRPILLASLPDYAIRTFAWSRDSLTLLVVSGSACVFWWWKEQREHHEPSKTIVFRKDRKASS